MSGMIRLLRSFRDGVALSRRRAWWRMLILFTLIKLTLFVVVFALSWVALAPVRQGLLSADDAMNLRSMVGSGLSMVWFLQIIDFSVGVASVGPLQGQEAPGAYARLLMNAVAARDANLASPIMITPSGDSASGVEHTGAMTEAQTLWPLAHPLRALALDDAIYILAALGGVVAAGFGIFLTVMTLVMPTPFHESPAQAALEWVYPLVIFLIGSAGVLWALVTRRFTRLEREGFIATVDVDGLTFRSAGRARYERHMRWDEARAFARILITDEMWRRHEVFVLSGADEDFIWEAMYTGPGASVEGGQIEEAARVAAHHLVEQVARRTGLPLLDLSPTLLLELTTNSGVSYPTAWTLFTRARSIARAQGDMALERELRRRQGGGPALAARLGAHSPFLRRLTPEQRDETLRLARELLPYYPTPAQMTPNPVSRFLIRSYWSIELTLQISVFVLFIANLVMLSPWSA